MITRKDAIDIAAELDLPEPIQRLVRGETLEPRLNTFWGNAEEIFLMKSTYGEGIFIPLWDDGNFDKLFAVHLPTGKFIEFDTEEGVDFDNLTLWNYQQILFPTFLGIFEVFIEDGEEECREELNYHADLFGFKYVEELMKIGKDVGNESWEAMEKAYNDFRKTLI